MKGSLWYKRIPTLLGLILLGVGLLTVSILVKSDLLFLTNASPAYSPENIRLSNQTDTSFSLSYKTDEKVLGSLSFGENKEKGKVALDDRDQQSGQAKEYNIHHITLRNLKPNTTYYYTINSSDKSFDDKGKPFTIKTLSALSQEPSRQQPIVGSVAYPDGTTDSNILVLLVTEDTQILSTLTKADGSFVLPLNALRSKDFTSYVSFSDSTVIKLLLQSEKYTSTISLLTSQINPVPKITISDSYDFTTGLATATPTVTASDSANASNSFPSFSATENLPAEPRIISPENKEGLTDKQPQFEGTAVPNEEVQIEIHSDPITTTVKANASGNWTYRPPADLSPGEHTVTIKTKDSKGILQTITRSFTVFAEGSQFTEPSVSPVQPTASPTPLPTAVPTALPSAIPTIFPTTTLTPTLSASPSSIISQTPEITSLPTSGSASPMPTIEKPGSSSIATSAIIAILMLGAGAVLFLLAKGNKAL